MAGIILNSLAVFGLSLIVSEAWEKTETVMYGFSQVSIVDTVFAVFFSIAVVLGINIWAALEDEDGEDGE
jgi:hypothetical protein